MRELSGCRAKADRIRPAWPWKPRAETDRGGVTMVMAALLGAGVLLGFGAVVIDVGQLYVERGELQSGADAAATAVAKQCAAGRCPSDPVALAYDMASRNAKDGTSNVSVCGVGITGLPRCPEPTAGPRLVECVGLPTPAPARYVEVRTTTRNPDGSTLLPTSFARTLPGNEGGDGTTVGACARASVTPGLVGRVWEGTMISLTVRVCYWSMYTRNGSAYPGTAGGAPPAASREQVLYLKDSRPGGDGTNGTSYCPGGDQTTSGNWGWLDDSTGADDCRALITTGTYVSADTGNNTPKGCESLLSSLRASRKPLMIPLFDDVAGNGNNARYHIAGIGAWVVTGYFLTSKQNQAESWLSGKHLCSKEERCIYGYFVAANFSQDVTRVENGTDFGATTSTPPKVSLIG